MKSLKKKSYTVSFTHEGHRDLIKKDTLCEAREAARAIVHDGGVVHSIMNNNRVKLPMKGNGLVAREEAQGE